MPDMNAALKDFIAEHQFPGELLYAKVWGSYSHNTNVEGSDIDFLAVYLLPTREVLRFERDTSLFPDTVDGKDPDFEAHEAAKFCGLLIKGNPAMLEMLFTDRYEWMSPQWKELVGERNRFLSQRAVDQYVGYARGQLDRLKREARLHTVGGTYNTKWAYHLIRVLQDGLRIAQGGAPLVWKSGEDLDALMAIRSGKHTPDDIVAMAESLNAQISAIEPNLPESGDAVFLDEWLLRNRVRLLS